MKTKSTNTITINYLSILNTRINFNDTEIPLDEDQQIKLMDSIETLKKFLEAENDYINFRSRKRLYKFKNTRTNKGTIK